MNRFFFLFYLLALSILSASGQYNCWIQFANKSGTTGTFTAPAEYLSQKAILRRAKQQILIDSTDLPVSKRYVESILQPGVVLKSTSKWLNGITVALPDTSLLSVFRALPYVRRIELTQVSSSPYARSQLRSKIQLSSVLDDTYGNADRQIDLHNGRQLHAAGFRGKGVVIGVIDAGFYKSDQIPAFDSLRQQNRLLGTWDVVDRSTPFFFNTESHGTSVLSAMAANLPSQMIGTSPDASYWLIRTEYSPSEYTVEVDNWVAGIEFADSVGVDIVNSSLGYTEFDDSSTNYTYTSMDGKTSRASLAATLAARKGMIVVNSAGNDGYFPWHYIAAPADADSILAVGAVDYSGLHASFSSYGPTSDGRIKPDVCAVGAQSVVASPTGLISTASGTSFSSPVMAGLVACVWQAFPQLSNMEIIRMIKQYSSRYTSPDNSLGYGIPDVYALYQDYSTKLGLLEEESGPGHILFFGNVLVVNCIFGSGSSPYAVLYTQSGQKVSQWKLQQPQDITHWESLPSGFYLLSVSNGQSKRVAKLVKR